MRDFVAVYIYNVHVYTGSMSNAATCANVHMELFGERGDTGSRKLLKSTSADKKLFCSGQVS